MGRERMEKLEIKERGPLTENGAGESKSEGMIVISERSKRVLPIIMAIAIFMQMLDTTILNTALPSIAEDMGQSALNMQSVLISYTLILALFAPLSGVMADRFGTKRVFLLALMLFSVGSLVAALSPNLTVLILARVVQGIGGALLSPVVRLALMKSYAKSDYLRVLNYAITPALIGPILGPVLGGYIVELASWHWIFLINLPIGLISILLSLKYMPDFRAKNVKFDGKGYLYFGSGVFLLTLGLEFLSRGDFPLLSILTMIIGAVLFIQYWHYAKIAAMPLFPWELFDIRTFRIGLRGNLVARFAISAMPFLLPLFLQVSLGYSPSESGWMLVPMAVGGIFIKPQVTKIIHRLGYRPILIWNTIFIAFSVMLVGLLGGIVPKWIMVLQLFILGIFNSLQFSAMNSLTISKLRPHQQSSGNSLMVVNQQLAMTVGIAVAALLLNFYASQTWVVKAPEEIGKAFKFTFVSVGFLTFLASFIFARLHPKDGDELANRE